MLYWYCWLTIALILLGVAEAVEFFESGGIAQFFVEEENLSAANTTVAQASSYGEHATTWTFFVSRAVDVVLLCQIIMKFQISYRCMDNSDVPRRKTGCPPKYEASGPLGTDKGKIANRYLKGMFFFDFICLVSSVTSFMNLGGGGVRTPLAGLRVLRILRVAAIFGDEGPILTTAWKGGYHPLQGGRAREAEHSGYAM